MSLAIAPDVAIPVPRFEKPSVAKLPPPPAVVPGEDFVTPFAVVLNANVALE